MAWTTPKAWPDGEVWIASALRLHIRDNMNVVSIHAHTGAAGDGAVLGVFLGFS